MKKVLFIFFCFLCISGIANAFTQEQALQISKNRIEALKHNYATLAYNCFMFNDDCDIHGNSQEAVVKWLSDELRVYKPDIRYASGADKFTIDGALRIAKTGNYHGAPVYFNEDLLVIQKSSGDYQPLGFFEILGVMVHEFGHHQDPFLAEMGLPSLRHEELDDIAAKVVTYLQDRTRKTVFTSDEVPSLKKDFFVQVLQIDIESDNGIRNIWSKVFIDSPDKTVEVSRSLVRGLQCPREYNHGHLTFIGEPNSAAFQKVRAPKLTLSASNLMVEQEVGSASVMCIDRKMGVYQVFSGYTEGRLRLVFNINADGTLTWNEGSSLFQAKMPKEYEEQP